MNELQKLRQLVGELKSGLAELHTKLDTVEAMIGKSPDRENLGKIPPGGLQFRTISALKPVKNP